MTIYIYTLSSSANPNDIRYVGKTKNTSVRLRHHLKIKRGIGKNTYANRWIQRELSAGNNIILTIIENVTVDNWAEKEMYHISNFRKLGYKLTNISLGGDGSIGYKHSEEAKMKISTAQINKKVCEETRKRISKSRTGMKFSLEHRKNLSKSHMGLPSNSKIPVRQLDLNGIKIAEFASINEAEIKTAVCSSAICGVCKGKRFTAGGYKWEYLPQPELLQMLNTL